MPTEQKMYACKSCNRKTTHLVQRRSHILHLLLSVVTLGLWIPVWILLALGTGAPECTICGKKYRGFRFR